FGLSVIPAAEKVVDVSDLLQAVSDRGRHGHSPRLRRASLRVRSLCRGLEGAKRRSADKSLPLERHTRAPARLPIQTIRSATLGKPKRRRRTKCRRIQIAQLARAALEPSRNEPTR